MEVARKQRTRGFLAVQTNSGNSLGSLKGYAMDWNAADMDETSSANPTAVAKGKDATPGVVHKHMLDAFSAIRDASNASEVSVLLLSLTAILFTYPPSP
jgi:hypothetical protein